MRTVLWWRGRECSACISPGPPFGHGHGVAFRAARAAARRGRHRIRRDRGEEPTWPRTRQHVVVSSPEEPAQKPKPLLVMIGAALFIAHSLFMSPPLSDDIAAHLRRKNRSTYRPRCRSDMCHFIYTAKHFLPLPGSGASFLIKIFLHRTVVIHLRAIIRNRYENPHPDYTRRHVLRRLSKKTTKRDNIRTIKHSDGH